MAKGRAEPLLRRYEGNPIISPEDIPFTCNTVFNGSPAKVDGQYYILLRVEGQQGHSVFALGRSDDGYDFTIEKKPVMTPAEEEPFNRFEQMGVEDPRVTLLEGVYYMIYTAYSPYGPVMAIARTEDFLHYERMAVISQPDNKDGVLFPEKLGGRYARFDRPIGNGIGRIWISYSDDLVNWGDSRVVISPRAGHWDSHRIGASAPPIKTAEGWLEIYHGSYFTPGGPIYRAGVMLLDLEDPSRVLGRSRVPVLAPVELYERIGDVNNVVFVSGAVVEPGGEVRVYYGAADTHICVAVGQLDDLIKVARQGGVS